MRGLHVCVAGRRLAVYFGGLSVPCSVTITTSSSRFDHIHIGGWGLLIIENC